MNFNCVNTQYHCGAEKIIKEILIKKWAKVSRWKGQIRTYV